MSSNRYPPQPAAMAKRLGQHLLLSLGVATAATLIATLPALLSGAPVGHGVARAAAEPPTMTAPALLQDGKIVDRLGGPAISGDEVVSANPAAVPAALVMPMSLNWPEGSAWMPPAQRVVVAGVKPRAGEGAVASSVRRSAPVRTDVAAGPLVILPPAAATALEALPAAEASRDDAWNRLVAQPATKVVDVVSGAADSVQAASTWGWSRATNLLPRW